MHTILYYRLPEVRRMFGGISKSQIYQQIAEGKFPKPVKLGPRTSAWRDSDLRAYAAMIDAQAAESRAATISGV